MTQSRNHCPPSSPGVRQGEASAIQTSRMDAAALRSPFEAGGGMQYFIWEPDAGRCAQPSPALRGQVKRGELLSKGMVVVMGLGAVAGRAFLQLARLGVGKLFGVDFDTYGSESWRTQPCLPTDAGKPKAQVLGAAAHAINPGIMVNTGFGFAQDLPLWLLRRADVLVVSGDNLEVLIWAGRMATALGKPLIQGAVHGESWTCLVRSFDLIDPDHACPACAMGPDDWSRLQSRQGCDPSLYQSQGLQPTRTLPNICAAASELLTGETYKSLLGLSGQALSGEELAYCMLTHRAWRTSFSRNPACRCPHERWELIDVPQPPAEVTLAGLLDQLAPEISGRQLWEKCQIRGESRWIRFAFCSACRQMAAVRRFGQPGSRVGSCVCGGSLIAPAWGAQSVIAAEDARTCADTPLAELGVNGGDAVGISLGERWSYFIVGDPPPIGGAVNAKP